jgi:antitoxin (DNA-binding transcriptional repressor) of toxin-antitoxin stability system
MPLDFGLLSMTELRTRPGEILDRVAAGEAFIIERGGRRRACLVPLSVFFPDVAPARIADEVGELVEHGEKPRATFTESHEMAFRFPQTLIDGTEVNVEVVLPHGYPDTCPRVYAKGIGGDPPHRWADGALCLYGVMIGWNPGKHTVFSTLLLARAWLRHYEDWRKTAQWPNPEGSPNA